MRKTIFFAGFFALAMFNALLLGAIPYELKPLGILWCFFSGFMYPKAYAEWT